MPDSDERRLLPIEELSEADLEALEDTAPVTDDDTHFEATLAGAQDYARGCSP